MPSGLSSCPDEAVVHLYLVTERGLKIDRSRFSFLLIPYFASFGSFSGFFSGFFFGAKTAWNSGRWRMGSRAVSLWIVRRRVSWFFWPATRAASARTWRARLV